MSRATDTAWDNGYAAWEEGKPITANPYDRSTQYSLYCHWLDGFYEAQEDDMNMQNSEGV